MFPTRKLSQIVSPNSDSDFSKLNVSTHLATVISCDNPFVMLALEQIQAAIVDDKSPTKQVLDREDYKPPTKRLMLKCKQHVKWEEAEQDEIKSLKTPISEGSSNYPYNGYTNQRKTL
jgi:hypothetical protein